MTSPAASRTIALADPMMIELEYDGIRRPDLSAQLVTDDGELILLRYDLAVIRSSERFLAALAALGATEFEDQYMRMAPQFEVGAGRYAWLCESLFLGRGRLTGPTRSHTASTACSERNASREAAEYASDRQQPRRPQVQAATLRPLAISPDRYSPSSPPARPEFALRE